MPPRPAVSLDLLLARYRATGAPAAFAAIFDATSDALFRIALTLVPDAAAAEDALQQTYVVAIRKLARLPSGRPPMPWLVNVLAKEASVANRARRRHPDAERLGRPRVPDVTEGLEAHDSQESVRRAIDALEEPYRSAALLRWRYGLEPAEIAHARGEPPGTTRSILSRALERLRKPLGVLPAVFIGGGSARRDMAGVREAVLHAAGAAAGRDAALAAISGGVLVKKTLIVVCLVAALVGGYAALRPDADRPARNLPPSPHASPRPETDLAIQPTRPVSGEVARRDERERAPAGTSVMVTLDGELRPQLPRGNLIFRGRLLDGEGKPIAAAIVRGVDTNPWPGAGPLPAVLSAADGTFAIPDLPSGMYSIWVNAGSGDHLVARHLSAGVDPVDLRPLDPTPPLRVGPKGPAVRIEDADGKPVPDADVIARAPSGVNIALEVTDGAFFRLTAEAEKQGFTYEIFGPRTKDGTRLPFGPATYTPTHEPDSDAALRLPVGMALEGTVTGPDGAGVFGADVIAFPRATEAEPATVMRAAHGRALTHRDGHFALMGLAPGAYRVLVLPLPPLLETVVAEARAGSRGVEIRLTAGVEAPLTIVDTDDTPVAGARVLVLEDLNGHDTPRGRAPQVTDAMGHATFQQLHPRGTYTLHVTPPPRRTDLGTWSAGWRPEATTVRLPRTWRLRGVANNLDGTPAQTQVWRRGTDGRWTYAATAASNGTFEIRDLPKGPWTIATMVSGYLGIEVTVMDASAPVSLVHDISRKALALPPR